NFNTASDATKKLVVNKATAVFSNLSGPTITYGDGPTTLSGTLKVGSLVPSGSVSITVNAVRQAGANNAADGTFSSSFATAAFAANPSGYAIAYSYAGDGNFDTASDGTKKLAVSKATAAFSNLSGPTITYGDGPTVLSGVLKAGSLVPSGSIS